jgi:phospholipid/cholesterol/gamma-HCH transport system ATP-binding protein
MSEAPVQIALRGVHKSFGPKVVLDGADLEVRDGESVVVIGGSGTGKSVLLKHIIGLLRPDSGTVEIDDRVAECLRLVRLEGVDKKMPSELSGGMRRRVGFARAIALKPQILLFDEPNTGLDPVIKALIDELIISMRETLGSTTVTITHDMRSAFRIADRIGMLHQGKIIALAPPDEFRELDNPIVQQFIHGRADGPLST